MCSLDSEDIEKAIAEIYEEILYHEAQATLTDMKTQTLLARVIALLEEVHPEKFWKKMEALGKCKIIEDTQYVEFVVDPMTSFELTEIDAIQQKLYNKLCLLKKSKMLHVRSGV